MKPIRKKGRTNHTDLLPAGRVPEGALICVLLLSLPLLLLAACGHTFYPEIERGSEYHYQDGYPEFRISAIGFLNEEEEGYIDVSADIVRPSLIYRNMEGVRQAEVEIEIQVTGRGDSTWSDRVSSTITVDGEEETDIVPDRRPLQYRQNLSVPPGSYEILVSVLDRASGNRITLPAETFVPDPEQERISLTSVQLLGKQNTGSDGYRPVTTYDVPLRNDSLRFVVQVTNPDRNEPVVIHSELMRFESDDSPARSLLYNNPSSMTLDYRGIDYNRRDVVNSSRRTIEQSGSVRIEYHYPIPERGNYRFVVHIEGQTDRSLYKARDFAVKSLHYPNVRTPRELAEPLVYLMGEREHRRLMEIENPDSLKEAIDYFWLSNIGSLNRARETISLYYERVEQANKQFSNFKEGWKTDMGMIYVLFGPPVFVQRHYGSWLWSYSYDIENPDYHFYFDRPRTRREASFDFEHHVLKRELNEYHVQTRQVDLWLSGRILQSL